MEHIPLLAGGREVSRLAVCYERPAAAAEPPLCLLYLHGFGSTQAGEKAEFFRRRALAAGFAFCSFDFEGHGQSGGTMRDLTLTRNLANIERVHAWLRERGEERFCLLGSSMGGGAALWYSALHPESIAAGLHLAPALDLDRGLLAWAGEEGARRWQESGTIDFRNELVACELGWELIEDLRRHPTAALVERYRTPALLLQGQHDATVPWRGVAEFAALCAGAVELHLFADGDHRLIDRKQRLWTLMIEFLQGRGLVSPAAA
jgi:pimeloyl-ACP methyl ester carboxylesterase